MLSGMYLMLFRNVFEHIFRNVILFSVTLQIGAECQNR